MKRDHFSLPLDLGNELIIDNFAGGGGASTGLERAFGRPVYVAINHDPEALAMHAANHPHTAHYCESVFDVDPIAITGNQPVALVWLSPDCKHFSKAKGGRPVSKKIRGLAWIALRWAAKVKPRVIMLENVEEFQTWGPLAADGKPCPKNRGRTFRSFVNALKRQGYTVEHRELRACDYGAPTIRKRLFLVARRDHLPIVWPAPTHGDPKSAAVRAGNLLPWRTAADCIDWSLLCPSIFERTKPLKDATLRRVAKGIMKFVVNSSNPFIVKFQENSTGQTLDEPLHTVMAGAPRFGIISPNLMHVTHQGGDRTASLDAPLATVTSKADTSVMTSHLVKLRNNQFGQDVREPMPTLTAGGGHVGEVRALLQKYHGPDALGIVTIGGEQYAIVDIGMRMLQPHELKLAQGFPASYVIDPVVNGKPLSKSSQVRMIGNSVCPDVATALIVSNFAHEKEISGAAA